MKKNEGKYETLDRLPANAKTVRQYAEENQITTSYVYKQIKEGKAKFKMAVFQSINFIIPQN